MIFARNCDALSYRGIHPNLDMALERLTDGFLSTVGSEALEIAGRDVYATRFTYQTVPDHESFFEAHKKYLDIHVMLEGSERVAIAPPETLEEFENATDRDFYAYRGSGGHELILSPGMFLVVFPDDAHKIKMQAGGPAQVTKAVFKIKIC